MGEIRIKSGNLYPIAIGEDMWNNLNDATHSNNNGELIVVMGTVDNSGVYSPSGSIIRTVHKDLSTYSWSVEIKADSPASLVIGFEGDGVKYFNITSEYQKLTFNNQSFISDRAFVMYNRTGVTRTVYLRNFMLNEGSTALPYQPYFLNRPAHQVTNGQWVDIPTHHFINGRWQGELTSQSPLKFRADGEMLDWRVEGKTSGNLFDINGEHISNSRLGITCFIVVDDKLVVQIISPGGTTRISYPNNFYNPNVLYTVSVKLTGELTEIRLLSTSPFPGGTYNTTYRAYWKAMTLNNGIYTTTFAPTETATIGFVVMGADDARNPGTVENIQLLEGSYTSDTLPPYEPYGGVGDWDETTQRYKIPVTVNGITTNLYTDHQLMDGDSIDYTTDQTAIPIATGNNVLTVDTAVQPSKVFVKFEG